MDALSSVRLHYRAAKLRGHSHTLAHANHLFPATPQMF